MEPLKKLNLSPDDIKKCKYITKLFITCRKRISKGSTIFIWNEKKKDTLNISNHKNDNILNTNLCTYLPNIETIYIMRHNIHIPTINPEFFKNTIKLKDITFLDNRIRNILPDTFRYVINLKEIIFENNYFKFITFNLFKYNYKLSSISIYANTCRTIPLDIFKRYPYLKKLSIPYINVVIYIYIRKDLCYFRLKFEVIEPNKKIINNKKLFIECKIHKKLFLREL